MADKKISQLDSTSSVNSDAVFPLSQTESGSLKTVKGTVEQIGDYIAKTQDHSTLNTVSKKIIGAINEILASGIEGTTSGSVASFADGGDNIPVKSLVAEIVASQAGSGTPSPSNPRAISGYTDVIIKNDIQGITQDTYTISLGSTVYGGVLDVLSGVLTVTHGFLEFDGSNDETWNYFSVAQGNMFRTTSTTKNYLITATNTLCNSYAPTTSRTDLTLSGSSGNFDFINNNFTDTTTWKTNLANNPITVCYPLSTPTTIQLTPTEVKTLLGENNIYANSGDVDVEYFNEDASQFNDLIETIITSSSSDYHVYSTNEKVVGRWIDGKTIYEKTVDISQYSVMATDGVWTNLFPMTNVDKLVFAELHGNSPNMSQILRFQANSGYIQVAAKTNIQIGNLPEYFVTFRYTKTTD